jgi:hypothetical protein
MSKTSDLVKFEKVTWRKVRQDVARVEPRLAELIDEIDPGDNLYFYRVRYPYGETIFKNGTLFLPDENGDYDEYDRHGIPQSVIDDLSYRVIPMGLVLKRSTEIFSDVCDRIIPLTIENEGSLFGVWEMFDPPHSYFVRLAWNMTSGARSIFMLPKIADASGMARLKRDFEVQINTAPNAKHHWQVFKKLINSSEFPEEWYSEILLFPKRWVTNLQKENQWLELQNYLHRLVWQQSMFWRFLITNDLIWQQFAQIVKDEGIKWGVYQLATVKHLIMLGVGALPGFTAQDPDELSAPINSLKEIFIENYQLEHFPTILVPKHFQSDEDMIVYYSINEPTLIENTPRSREVSNFMEVTRQIRNLFLSFKKHAIAGALEIENTPMFVDFFDNVEIDFFHQLYDPGEELMMSSKLPEMDHYLLELPTLKLERSFCHASSFLKGCARVRAKE